MTHELTGVDVCTDCYFAHHYGAHSEARRATDAEAGHYRFADHNSYHARQIMGLEFYLDMDVLMVREWFTGESDMRCEGGEPLSLIGDDVELSDWTYDESDPENAESIAEHGDGHTTFTWSACQGCGVNLGGSRERLAIWHKEAT